MTQLELIETIRTKFPEAVGQWREMTTGSEYQRIRGSYLELLQPETLRDIAFFIRDTPSIACDSLLLISSVDNADGTLSVVYHFESTKIVEHKVAIKVTLNREHPVVPSLAMVWLSANWHEREAFDLMGIEFTGHPDLRRILMDDDWIGHPLRKDFETPEFYHGMKVPY